MASTPDEVERTFESRAMRASVVEVKRECAKKGSWVALSEAIVCWVMDMRLCTDEG